MTPFSFLDKKQLKVSIVLTSTKQFLVFDFSQGRRKALRGKRQYFCRIITGHLEIPELFEELRIWLEANTEDYILERLEDSPSKYQPIFKLTPRLKIDFNVTKDEVFGATSIGFLSS